MNELNELFAQLTHQISETLKDLSARGSALRRTIADARNELLAVEDHQAEIEVFCDQAVTTFDEIANAVSADREPSTDLLVLLECVDGNGTPCIEEEAEEDEEDENE